MTGKLQEMMKRIEHLPQPVQAQVTGRIEEMLAALEDQAWEEAFADPASDAFFARAEAEIARAQREGSIEPLFPGIQEAR